MSYPNNILDGNSHNALILGTLGSGPLTVSGVSSLNGNTTITGTLTVTGTVTSSAGSVIAPEIITAAGPLSTTKDSIINSLNGSYTVTLADAAADNTVKIIKLSTKASPPVTVKLDRGGTFVLDASGHERTLRYTATYGWISEFSETHNFYVTTQQGAKLVGTGPIGNAFQGGSVSVSADGNTLACGGDSDNTAQGAVWIFTRSGGVWSPQGAKLVGTGPIGSAGQGGSVSLSADGNTLASGASGDDGGIGAVWIFTRSGGAWTQQGAKLVGTGKIGIQPYQGHSVSLSADGNTLASGGYNDDTGKGAVWIFTRSGGVWTQQGAKLLDPGNTAAAWQGWSVSLSSDGNTLASGGYKDNTNIGATWIFTRSGTTWAQFGSKIVGTGNVNTSEQGRSVAIAGDGNTLAIGGSGDNASIGAVWIFIRSGGVWSQQTKLIGTGYAGLQSKQGNSVSLSTDGNVLSFGGPFDNTDQGGTWLFTRDKTLSWVQKGNKIVGTGNAGAAQQGYSVSLSSCGNTLAIGGYLDNSNQGATWVYI